MSLQHMSRRSTTIHLLSDLTTLGSSALWGIGISQTFHYLVGYRKERLRIIVLIMVLCIFDTLREAFTIYSQITLFFNIIVYFSHATVPSAIIALVAVTAQLFFVYRIYIMSRKKIVIPIIATSPTLFQLCVTPIFFNAISSDVISTAAQKNILAASLATGVAIDISLSVGLSALLWQQYMRGTFMLKSTKRMLQQQTLFSVNTGMWTALATLIVFVIFMSTGSDDFMVYGYFHIMSPMYFVTVLANINARSYLRKRGTSIFPTHMSSPGTMVFAEVNSSAVPWLVMNEAKKYAHIYAKNEACSGSCVEGLSKAQSCTTIELLDLDSSSSSSSVPIDESFFNRTR